METTATKSSPKFRLNSAMFLVGTLLFLLPFVNIKCKGETLISNNGVGLAFGVNYKTSKEIKTNDESFDKRVSVTEKESGRLYVSALLALLLGVAGFVLSIVNPGPNKMNALIGTLAAIALIGLMIQIRSEISDKSDHDMIDSLSRNTRLTVEFTAWYYLALISFISAAFFSFLRKPIVISN
ncbi:MAG TPA: hypothetical protein VNT20_19535 [Flavisolibacter sp.]|jgi:hypothetical protein|nr:hypothetical protein [Flavisolibacter sp.]